MRAGHRALGRDHDFIADYERITKERPDFVTADEVQLVFEKMRAVRPEIRKILKDSIGG